jgi:NTP pyrophosphatase (non-canonical NTP hydrolase)
MTPKELASECQAFIAKATGRITGIGAEQYHVEGQPQRFETMPLDGLFEYAEEELLDLANYAAMLNIRMRRLREEATRDQTFARMADFFKRRMPLLSTAGQQAKLREELEELLSEPSAEEAADVAIVLGAMAHTHGWDLDAAIAAKMKVNEARVWELHEGGFYKHRKTAPLGPDPAKAATA